MIVAALHALRTSSAGGLARPFLGVVGMLVMGLTTARAVADEWHLKNGAVLRGIVQPVNPSSNGLVVMDCPSGIRIKLDPRQLRHQVAQPSARLEYDDRSLAQEDTVTGHWELAEWCRTHGLPDERRRHLRRVVELDGNHARAWRALGYSYVNGQWVLPNEAKQSQGYVYYQGRWKLTHEAAQLENQRRIEQVERDWLAKIKRWRADLETSRATAAWRQLQEIRDPAAVWGMQQALRRERSRKVKLLYLDVLHHIDDKRAWDVLLTVSLTDPDDEIFYQCVDLISSDSRAGTVQAYVERLRDADNRVVNRAAYALGRLKDRSVISPLIDALVTPHRIVARPGTNQTTLQFSQAVGENATPTGGMAFSTGGSGPRRTEYATILVPNQDVHQALVRLTGVSFGYEQARWRRWYAWFSSTPADKSLEGRASAPSESAKLVTPQSGG